MNNVAYILQKLGERVQAFVAYWLTKTYIFCCPLRERKFFCISMSGNSYGDSVKCLTDYLSTHHPEAEIVWAFSSGFFKKSNCPHKGVKLYSFSYYYHILTSKYILSNARLNQRMLHKRKGQVYIQTWHGTALKRLGTDIDKKRSAWKELVLPSVFKHDVRHTDIMISGSTFMSSVFRDKFLFKGDLWETGMPRNDIFFHDHSEVVEKVRREYGIADDMQIVLYAPTFRNDRQFTYYDFDYKNFCQLWQQRTGKSCVFMVRLHPILLYKSSALEQLFGSDTINASAWPDMQELLCAADVLVTDYSSSMFDFMLSGKPVVMYTPDADSYSNGFYFHLDGLPFIRMNDNSEMEKALQQFNTNKYKRKIEAFLDKIGNKEKGDATHCIIEKIFSQKYAY